MSVEALIGVATALVALVSATITMPCWAPLFSRDATQTTDLLKGKKRTLELLTREIKQKTNAVYIKRVSRLFAESDDLLLGQLANSKMVDLEGKTKQKCVCGLVPHLCLQNQARSEMGKLITELDILIKNAESIIDEGYPCRGYRQPREVQINGKKRGETRDKIWEAVKSTEKTNVICIHGALGVGKTAMAKWIHNRALNDENEKLFRFVVWVDLEFGADVDSVQILIAKSLDMSLDDCTSTIERGSKLGEALSEMGSFLLVLDSLRKPMSLKEIGIPELVGRQKVMVTSSLSTICDQTGEVIYKFELQGLDSEEEAWEFFKKETELTRVEREGEIKRALIGELDGLPSAILKYGMKMVNTPDEPSLQAVTDQELLGRFRDSYLDLDEKMKACFMYCALFPKGHLMNAKELIEYWMWEGFLGDFDTLEDGAMEGKKALQELQNRHLLEWASGDHEKVKMLSSFRNMAIETMAKQGNIVCIRSGSSELASLPPWGRDWNSNVERASFINSNLKVLNLDEKIKSCTRLLTLLLQDNLSLGSIYLNIDFFSSMRSLRVLDMSRTQITTLPISISRLKDLRALLLRDCSNLTQLPNLSELQQLIVLDVSGSALQHCPSGIESLKGLRRLDFSQTKLSSFPNNIVVHLIELEELLMITESDCFWRTTEDDQETACVEDLCKLKKLVAVQLRFRNTRALNKYLSYVKEYTSVPPRFCFLVGDIHGGSGLYLEENSLTVSGIDAYRTSSNSELSLTILRSLRWLNVLDVSNFSGLTYLFTVEILKSLTMLRELRVTSCGDMVELVQGATQTASLPKLTRLLLFDLPSLKSVCCGQVLHCPQLQSIEVWECQNLKFPMIKCDTSTWRSNPLLKIHVKGGRSWWFGKLEWDNNGNPIQGFGVSPRSNSNFTKFSFSEAPVPPELTPRRKTRLQLLESQAEEPTAVIQTNNTVLNRFIGTIGFRLGWAQSNLIGKSSD